MVQEADLKQQAEQLGSSVDSIDELLRLGGDLCKGDVDSDKIKAAQRQALLDSLKVKRFHKSYKQWENQRRDDFIEKEVRAYNKKYAQVTRLHTELAELDEKYRDMKKSVSLPAFNFSKQTLKEFEEGRLLEGFEDKSSISLDSLYSLDPSTQTPPDYQTFNKLMNLEFRLRTISQIKYEVLLRVRTHLTSKNSQWAKRDASLNEFLRSVREKIDEVKKIRTAESQDLRDVDAELDIDFSDDEDHEKEDDDKEDEEKDGDEQDKENDAEDNDNEADGKEGEDGSGNVDSHMETDNEFAEENDRNDSEEDEEHQENADEPDGEDAQQEESKVDEENIDDREETPALDAEPTDMLID
ncbi:uncharacterized protein CXQ87_003634 [Candidozyma duobushaemuli]|uniref:Uncharacterized protein n=2 Tax=Candidozyma TaxID=3303203 RepID=A0ABX8I8B6_9ASCO|nr:uncharacterized protein CXQ87_003634 [[Candida] duobushaemulonis]PVH15780.1 hypothetical protein CXQ87_003634 [[Candida] duobushaemulonis]QWU89511.1 hypothetical protein CA3LBN_003834 [[Candida] haemuloni]